MTTLYSVPVERGRKTGRKNISHFAWFRGSETVFSSYPVESLRIIGEIFMHKILFCGKSCGNIQFSDVPTASKWKNVRLFSGPGAAWPAPRPE